MAKTTTTIQQHQKKLVKEEKDTNIEIKTTDNK